MIPHWCAAHPLCWEHMVDRWCSPEWDEAHDASRERHMMMQGPSHHQGIRSLGLCRSMGKPSFLFRWPEPRPILFLTILLVFL
jgi:hypothetical protein